MFKKLVGKKEVTKDGTVWTAIRVPDETRKQIKILATRANMSMGEYVDDLVYPEWDKYLILHPREDDSGV